MLRVCELVSIIQYAECSLLLLATSASDLPLRTISFCFVLFRIVVHAGCDKPDSLMRVGLRLKRTTTLAAVWSTVETGDCTSLVIDPKARY